ncbi:MAG TPA: enoyl-CoA hydratase/isomerase family protein [Solirubrobacteraceae bacterium]|jgi:enoyl-CoA hydratase/carnithine racemase|nr:enoyl-CoA hydratase/isomerase family protein [Solirubrobacteraceae bacterium]
MLEYRVAGPIAWITLDRPPHNAMVRSMYAELRGLLARAAGEGAVRAVILHGAGRSFSVGGDIDDFATIGGLADRRDYMLDAMSAFQAVEECPLPVIAAVHGFALGGGCELAMVADVVIADETARFGTPEATVGLTPGPGIARGLAQCNLHWMKLMVLGAEQLDAREARLAGIVNRVVPEGEHVAAAEALATRMAGLAPLALEAGKRLLNDNAPQAWRHAIDHIVVLQSTDDFQEGIAAFRERREPRFNRR